MANINIYGELHNDTPNGFVASSKEIMDTEMGMRQSEINEELMREVSDSNTAYLVCSTPGSTAAKTIDLDNFTLSTNVRLLIKMEHAHTNTQYTPTLNIGGTGMESIQFEGSAASYMNTWADGEVLDVYYDGTQYVAKRTKYKIGDVGYVECNTAAGTVGKEVNDFITLSGFELGKNVRVLVKMINTNTASNPTLNINGTGAKGIIYNGIAVSSSNVWEAGEVLDIYYDGTNYQACLYSSAQFATGEKVKEVGIDDEPVSGSENLVKSGGVYEEVSRLDQEIGFSEQGMFPEINIGSGYIAGNNGSVNEYAGISYMECVLDGSYKYISFTGCTKTSSGTIGFSFYDSSNNAIGYGYYDTQEPIVFKKYTIEIPSNAVKFRATIPDDIFTDTQYYIFLANQIVSKSLQEQQDEISLISGKINNSTFKSKYVKADGSLGNNSNLSVYTLKVKRNDELRVEMSSYQYYPAIAFSTSEAATSGLSVIQNGVNYTASTHAKYTYFCSAKDDGWFYFTANEPVEYTIVRRETYENDDAYYQSKYENQLNIYPKIGACFTGEATGALLLSENTRIIFKLFLEPNTTTLFNLINPNELSLSFNNLICYSNGNYVSSSWASSLTDGIVSVTNPTSNNSYCFIALKKTNNASFSESDLVGLKLVRKIESAEITGGNAEFVAVMNQYKTRLGMTNSDFVNCFGGYSHEGGTAGRGYNESCVSDILKMSISAWSYEKVRYYMSIRSVDAKVFGDNERTATIVNNTYDLMDSYYTTMKNEGQVPSDFPSTNPFILLGTKGGGWSFDGHEAWSLVAFTMIDGNLVCGVTATNDTERYNATTGRIARVKGMIELFCIATKLIRNESITGMDTTFVEKAIVALVPYNCGCYTNISITPLWSKNPTDLYNPASTTKILSSMVMFDVLSNQQEYHEIISSDMSNDSDYTAYVGDVESVETSMFAMLVASNGTNTKSLARLAGNKMIESKNKFV